MEIKNTIFNNPRNNKILKYFDVKTTAYFESWKNVEFVFEGERYFFEQIAKDLPETTKYKLDLTSILVNEENGLIFGVHFGRFTFIFRCDFERNGFVNPEKYQVCETLDASIDIRELGNDWAILNCFAEDEENEQILWAYYLSNKEL